MLSSIAAVPTPKPAPYMKQLCRHFGHQRQVTFDDRDAVIELEQGRCELRADSAGVLRLRALAASAEGLAAVEGAIGRHLVRFGRRDGLDVQWAAEEAPHPVTSQSASLAALDRAHLIHPRRPPHKRDPIVIVRGEGCRIWDAEGREYLDATAGLAVTQVGHGREELAVAASTQMRELEYYPSWWEYANPRAIELAARLVGLAPAGLRKVFFTSGGSEGVEAALRMARLYQHAGGAPERTVVLTRTSAYHGAGYGSGSLTGLGDHHVGFAPMLPDVRHLTPPWACRTELFDGRDPTDFCADELQRTIDELGADRIAAFIGEPVLGAAGMVTPPDDYWPRIVEILRAHDILLIVDEVITGYGRSGHWFASERYGLEPDIMVTAKGLTSGYVPLGAVLVSDAVAERLERGPDGFPIGFTYSGHPTACAVALANLDIIERERLVDRARALGEELLAELAPLSELPLVNDLRGAGLMVALELDDQSSAGGAIGPSVASAVREEHGVIVRAHGGVVSLSPPLSLSDEELRRIAVALRDVVERVDQHGDIRP